VNPPTRIIVLRRSASEIVHANTERESLPLERRRKNWKQILYLSDSRAADLERSPEIQV